MSTPKTGDLVVCSYRMPSVHQPWIHPVWIGAVQEPGDDPEEWNGHNSERHFCEQTGRLPVRYYNPLDRSDCFVRHDDIDSLSLISEEDAQLTGAEAVGRFLGQEALANWNRAMGGQR